MINSGDVKDETLKTQDLKDGEAVQSSDVIDDSLGSDDVDDLQTQDYDSGSVENSDLATDSVSATKISVGAVQTAEIFDGAVGAADIGSAAVTASELGNSSVGAGKLAAITAAVDDTPFDFGDQDEGNGEYVYGISTAACPAGTSVISGGAEWVGAGQGGGGGNELQAITESQLSGNGWTAQAASDVDDQDFRAIALCLATGT